MCYGRLASTQQSAPRKRCSKSLHFPIKKNINPFVAIVYLFPPLVLAFAENLPAKLMAFSFCLDTFFYLT
jgi:hypothetical protein